MNKFISSLLVGASLSLFYSCGSVVEKSIISEEPLVNWESPFVSQRLQKFSEEVKYCLPKVTEKCVSHKAIFTKAKPQKTSEGQRILLLSTEGEPVYMTSFLKYKDRVLDHYHPNGNHELESFTPVIHYPKVLNDIFVENNYFSDNGFEGFSNDESYVLSLLHNILKKENPTGRSAHYSHFTNFILNDLNPQAQFVYVRIPDFDAKDLAKYQDNMSAVQELYTQTLKSLGKIIRKYKLNYVQLPSFANIGSLHRYNNNEEGSPYVSEEILHDYLVIKSNFLDQLTSKNPDVRFFQELPDSRDILNVSIENASHYFGRTRRNLYKVGFWESKMSQEDFDKGINHNYHLPIFEKDFWFVTDLFVNYSSTDNDQDKTRNVNQIYSMYHGVHWQSLGVLRPDVSTALALSYHNYLDKKTKLGDDKAMNQWQEALRVKMIDPNRQHRFLKYDKKN